MDAPHNTLESLEAWSHREIFAHEAELMRFLSRKWTHSCEVQDIRHDIYVRVLEAAERQRARIVSIDLLQDIDSLNVLMIYVSNYVDRLAVGIVLQPDHLWGSGHGA